MRSIGFARFFVPWHPEPYSAKDLACVIPRQMLRGVPLSMTRSRVFSSAFWFTIGFVAITCGCAQNPASPAAPSVQTAKVPANPPPDPYLLHLPGISGESVVDHHLVRGLKAGFTQAGEVVEIQIYDWTENNPGIPALQAYKRNHAEAKIISDMLTAHYRADPKRPIYLTCHSGGAGLAVWALEDLPADVSVETLLMLAPALSPQYDLSAALRHVQKSAEVFWSDQDTGILDFGTRTFGTIDGVYSVSAGYVGFTRPPKGDITEYAKLHQHPYEAAWVKYGNFGQHIGPTETVFA
jgi:hypothetical protein